MLKNSSKNNEAISSFESYINLYNNFKQNLSLTYYTFDNLDDSYYYLYELFKDENPDIAKDYLIKIHNNKYNDQLLNLNFLDIINHTKNYNDLKSYENLLLDSNQLNKLENFYINLERK